MHFKTAIMHMHERVSELVEAAAMLPNQNLADILKASASRLKQASEHADCEAVDAAVKAHSEKPPAFDPSKIGQ